MALRQDKSDSKKPREIIDDFNSQEWQFHNLKNKAKQGDANAQYELAAWMDDELLDNEAREWCIKSARQGNADACFLLGEYYMSWEVRHYSGLNQEQCDKEGIEWYLKAVQKEHPEACREAGMIYLKFPDKKAEGIDLLYRAGKLGYARAYMDLCLYFMNIVHDEIEGIACYRKARDLGHKHSLYRLYRTGTYDWDDLGLAGSVIHLITTRAYCSDKEAQRILGYDAVNRCEYFSEITPDAYAEAYAWFAIAVENETEDYEQIHTALRCFELVFTEDEMTLAHEKLQEIRETMIDNALGHLNNKLLKYWGKIYVSLANKI